MLILYCRTKREILPLSRASISRLYVLSIIIMNVREIWEWSDVTARLPWPFHPTDMAKNLAVVCERATPRYPSLLRGKYIIQLSKLATDLTSFIAFQSLLVPVTLLGQLENCQCKHEAAYCVTVTDVTLTIMACPASWILNTKLWMASGERSPLKSKDTPYLWSGPMDDAVHIFRLLISSPGKSLQTLLLSFPASRLRLPSFLPISLS